MPACGETPPSNPAQSLPVDARIETKSLTHGGETLRFDPMPARGHRLNAPEPDTRHYCDARGQPDTGNGQSGKGEEVAEGMGFEPMNPLVTG